MKYILSIKPPIETQPSVALTMESMGIFLGILVSLSMLITGIIQVITKFNVTDEKIRDLKEANNNNAKAIEEFKALNSQLVQIDKKLDLYLQDSVNRNEMTTLLITQLKETAIADKEKWGGEIEKVSAQVSQIERYLQAQTSFRIRE